MFFTRLTEKTRNSRIGTGKAGEDLAVRYLENLGYVIVERNYRKRIGEIDIIAHDCECLVFVEVKARRGNRYGSPFDAVTPRKQQQISRVALAYLTQHRSLDVLVRFDVVAVYLSEHPARIELIKDAFEYIG